MEASLDVFRGIVLAAAEGREAVHLTLLPVEEGFELRFGEHVLGTARGGRRVFKTIDAAFSYTRQHIVSPRSPRVSLVIQVTPLGGQLF